MLPTFIGIGAQRAGTTWVHACLAQHPEIYMTRPKELHFFYVHYARGLDWYERQFAPAAAVKARGEITPDYMYHEEAIRNMAKDIPDAKLFVVLRNPVERTVSAYRLFHERFQGMSLRAAFTADPDLIERGRYLRYLDRVYAYFPPQQVKVLLYDDIKARPLEFLDELYDFLGVSGGFIPVHTEVRYNRVIYPRLQQLLLRTRLGWIIDTIKTTSVGQWIRRKDAGRQDSDIAAADLHYLKTLFYDDTLELGRRLGRDLSAWVT